MGASQKAKKKKSEVKAARRMAGSKGAVVRKFKKVSIKAANIPAIPTTLAETGVAPCLAPTPDAPDVAEAEPAAPFDDPSINQAGIAAPWPSLSVGSIDCHRPPRSSAVSLSFVAVLPSGKRFTRIRKEFTPSQEAIKAVALLCTTHFVGLDDFRFELFSSDSDGAGATPRLSYHIKPSWRGLEITTACLGRIIDDAVVLTLRSCFKGWDYCEMYARATPPISSMARHLGHFRQPFNIKTLAQPRQTSLPTTIFNRVMKKKEPARRAAATEAEDDEITSRPRVRRF